MLQLTPSSLPLRARNFQSTDGITEYRLKWPFLLLKNIKLEKKSYNIKYVSNHMNIMAYFKALFKNYLYFLMFLKIELIFF